MTNGFRSNLIWKKQLIKKVSLFTNIKLPILKLPRYIWFILIGVFLFNGLFWLGGLEFHPLERTGYMVLRTLLDMAVGIVAFVLSLSGSERTGRSNW